MITPSCNVDCTIPPTFNCLKICASMDPQQVADLIRQAIPDTQVDVRSDDNTHFSALLVGKTFEGMRSIARHQLVYRALGERVGREIHALSIEAYTPEEWSARPGGTTRGG
jgi:acid stress-induced BolA-like protein IbaG/YrbA